MKQGASRPAEKGLEALRSGDQAGLKPIYLTYRRPFVEWLGASFRADTDAAREVYQEVMIVLYEQSMSGKLGELKGSLRNYLFGIGKHLWLQRFRQGTKWADLPEEEQMEAVEIGGEQLELTERQQQMQEVLQQMGSPCQELLLLFYYHRNTTESIMHKLDYKNTDVVKSQKARCLRRLKQQFRPQLDQDMLNS